MNTRKSTKIISPTVSFIIPVLNGEKFIERCLRSIKNLAFPDDAFEVIIIDNGSTDKTHQIIADLGFKFHVIKGVNVSALRNQGTKQANGCYFAFVDSDVELSPSWIESALNSFSDKTVVASGCFPRVPPDATWVQATWDIHQSRRQLITTKQMVAWLPSMNVVVRREEFLRIGGFDEDLETAEDVDLCYRLGACGTILCAPAMEAIHWGEAQDLKTFWRKEIWRGSGNLKGILSHGLRWDELPSLGYPLYVLMATLLCMAAPLIGLWHWRILLMPVGLFTLTLPAMCLAINTAYRTQKLEALPKLFVLYFIYGLARAYSIVRTCMRSFGSGKR
jgi:glycosyltransferase involved in cell wall biosynthesis